VVGFGAAYGGISAVHWDKVGIIAASWVISPLLSGIISYFIFRFILRRIFYNRRPFRAAKKLTPYIVFVVFAILSLTMVFKGLKNLKLDLSLPDALVVAMGVGLVTALISLWLVSRMPDQEGEIQDDEDVVTDPAVVKALDKAMKHLEKVHSTGPKSMKREISDTLDEVRRLRFESERRYKFHTNTVEYQRVEKLFVYLQILSACFIAFAQGANDVANAIGPMSAVISVALAGGASIAAETPVPLWVLALGGIGIVFGLATWGWRVMETIGHKITQLTPSRGFCALFGAATTIILATRLGLPISTTHTLVGAVLGVGLARGISAVNLYTVRDIFLAWIVTIPAGAALAVVFFYGLRLFFM
jgi:PiT family inorganic phosphate transporter